MAPDAGMQKTDANVIERDEPTGVNGPAAAPFSTIA
jgi:hypothetical protein